MTKPATALEKPTPGQPDFLFGGGKMARVVAATDWSQTPLGPIETWPQSLRTTVSLCLASNFPISIAWGKGCTQIYNDGYWPICGAKHPQSMGQDFRECWSSPWPAIGEAFESAWAGEARFLENQRMFLDRNGYLEETFFTFSFSPIRDESGQVGGLFHPVIETTTQMLSERRTKTLRDLTASPAHALSVEDYCVRASATLANNRFDIPFALLYLFNKDESALHLVSTVAVSANCPAGPAQIEIAEKEQPWPIAAVLRSGAPELVENFAERLGLNARAHTRKPPPMPSSCPFGFPAHLAWQASGWQASAPACR